MRTDRTETSLIVGDRSSSSAIITKHTSVSRSRQTYHTQTYVPCSKLIYKVYLPMIGEANSPEKLKADRTMPRKYVGAW